MGEKKVIIQFEPEGRKVSVGPGITILEAAKCKGVGLRSECGGKGNCRKCTIILRDQTMVSKATNGEREHFSEDKINEGYRLACCTKIFGNLVVEIPPESRVNVRKIQVLGLERPVSLEPLVKKLHIVIPKPTLQDVRSDFERVLDCLREVCDYRNLSIGNDLLKILSGILRDADWSATVAVWNDEQILAVEPGDTTGQMYGFAVDIGTSKIAGYLVDLKTGKTVGEGSVENPQIVYGEDIITRLDFTLESDESLGTMQRLSIKGINSTIMQACNDSGVNPNYIYELAVTGNTVMHHFFLGLHSKYLSLSPFPPVIKQSRELKNNELTGLKMNMGGNIHVLPVIAGYVGADAIGDVYSTGILNSNAVEIVADIGTNGEVFVSDNMGLLSCSCAAGPAFEGAHIKHGMKAYTGAIESVHIDPKTYEVKYETIGGDSPTGICGSGIIDLIAELLKAEIIDNRGRFMQLSTPRLKMIDEEPQFVVAWSNETGIADDITITQRDIKEVQLAKAAMHAGTSILMKAKHIDDADINRFCIAGAFGSHIRAESALFIGLIPDIPLEKVEFVGNTALSGAKSALISKEA